MQYMITFNHTEGEWERLTPGERERHKSWLGEFMSALETKKDTRLVFLSPVTQAKTVRKHSDGRLEVIDGPSRPSPEQQGGYYIIEAESMDEAVEWAKKGRFMVGSNEVREIVEYKP